jgi:hypothetical protein
MRRGREYPLTLERCIREARRIVRLASRLRRHEQHAAEQIIDLEAAVGRLVERLSKLEKLDRRADR